MRILNIHGSVSFQAFIPNFTLSNDLENDHSVEQMLEYLQDIDGLMNVTVADSNIQYITQAAFYDTMGGCVLTIVPVHSFSNLNT